jgi:translation initiation factor 4E
VNIKIFKYDIDFYIFSLFNHIKPPSQLSLGCDYNYFKNGIKPMWEDKRNSNGGRWLLQLPLAKNSPLVDNYWKNIVRTN